MFTARTVVIVAPGAGGVAASSANRTDNALSAAARMTATLAVVRPASAVPHTPKANLHRQRRHPRRSHAASRHRK
jgi:hypothetical protein